MELTSENKREICETYDRLLDERNHVISYLGETYFKGLFYYDDPLNIDTSAIQAEQAKSIVELIAENNKGISRGQALNYIMRPDFEVKTFVPQRTLDKHNTTIQDAFLYRHLEDQILLGDEVKVRLDDRILSKSLRQAIRIRKIQFSQNIFVVLIKELYLLPGDSIKFDKKLERISFENVREIWQEINDKAYAYDDKIERVFTSQEEFERFIIENYNAHLNREWIKTGTICLDNRTTKPTINDPEIEEIRTLAKQRKYYKA